MQDLNQGEERKLNNKLRQVYRTAALSLALGMSMEEAAAHSHLAETELQRYMRDPRFQSFLDEFNQEIEGKLIERALSRRNRILAKVQTHAEEAVDHAISIMRTSGQDNVRWNIIKGFCKQIGVDFDANMLGDVEMIEPEKVLERKDPGFLQRAESAMKELEAFNRKKDPSVQ